MKAIVQDTYGPTEVLELREIDQPKPRDDELLVRVHAAGVDAGTWILMTGRPYGMRLAFGLRRPRIAVRGTDLAGVVTAIGAQVTGFRPGDEVYGFSQAGVFAEYATAQPRRLARKPANLTFEQAAAVPVSGVTALHSVRDAARVQPGQRVLITGAAGGVGSFAVQLAKAYGATVTGVCRTAKVDLVRSLGADDVIDYTAHDIDHGGGRYDTVINIGGTRPLAQLRRVLTPRGTLVLVGGGHQTGPVLGGFGRQMAAPLISMFVGQTLRGVSSRVSTKDLEDLTTLLKAGKLTPAVGRTYPLADAPDAMRDYEVGRAEGKLVITV